MRRITADLHIHTALSPCAAAEMTPPAIVRAALEKGLAMIAICDHNAAGNVAAAQRAAGDALTVLAGMEITTSEEVHVVGLFPDAAAAEAAAREVGATLPLARPEDRERFGEQRLMDERGDTLSLERRLLAAATSFSLTQAINLIHQHDGLAIAAHIDRPSFSVLSQLGMIPPDADFDALEVFTPCDGPSHTADFASYGLPLVASSDSHYLLDIGRVFTALELEEPSFRELASALDGAGGRSVCHA